MKLWKVLCVTLVLLAGFTTNVAQAQQIPTLNEYLSIDIPQDWTVGEALTTSKDELIQIASKFIWDQETGTIRQVNTTLLKASPTNKVTKELQHTNAQLVEWQGKVYVTAYNMAHKQFEVYDEQFNLIDTEPLTLNVQESIDFKEYGHYVAIQAYTKNEWSYKRNREVVVYDFNKQALVNHVKVPYSHAEVDETAEGNKLHLVDQLGRITASYNTKNYPQLTAGSRLLGQPVEHNGLITFFTYKWMSTGAGYVYRYELITMTKEGYLVNVKQLDVPTNTELKIYQHGKMLQLYVIDSYQVNETSELYGYDLETFQLYSGGVKPYFIWHQSRLSDAYYFEHRRENDVYMNVIKTNDHQELYALEHKNGFPVSNGRTYIVYDNKLASLETGEVLYNIPNVTAKWVSPYTWLDEHSLIYTDSSAAGTTVSLFSLNQEVVSQAKAWTVTFNQAVDVTAPIADYVYVKDANDKLVDVEVSVVDGKVRVDAPVQGYEKGATYTLFVDAFTLENGKSLSNPQTKQFTISR